jgi:hypothetical protein
MLEVSLATLLMLVGVLFLMGMVTMLVFLGTVVRN